MKMSNPKKFVSILLVLSILGAIGTIAYIIVTPKSGEKFTEFYMLGPEGKAKDYPEELLVEEEGRVTLVIVNQEDETTSYRIEVWINGKKVNGNEEEEELKVWEINTDADGNEEEAELGIAGIKVDSLANNGTREKEIGFKSDESCGSTTLSASVTQGQRILPVEGTGNFEVNDYIQIGDIYKENVEFVRINDVTGSEITIDKELDFDHDAEDPVTEKKKVEFRLFKNEDSVPYLILYLYVHFRPS